MKPRWRNKSLKRLDSIQREYFTGKVYNLEIEEANSYFANGILVHNCGALWARPEETHPGGEKAKESFGKSEELVSKAVVKPLPDNVANVEAPEKEPKEIKPEDIRDFGGTSQVKDPTSVSASRKTLLPSEKVITG